MLLGPAGDREVFIARTTEAKTYSEGFAYRRKAELTAAFANRVSPVRSFFNVNGTPVMQTGAGVIAIVPTDYVYWSPGLAQLISNTGTQGQICITGSASQLAHQLPGWARLEDRAQGRRAFGEIASLLLRDGNAPRRAADRHRFDNVKRRHVDHRDVVAVAIGGE
jgi:hypothetical protein